MRSAKRWLKFPLAAALGGALFAVTGHAEVIALPDASPVVTGQVPAPASTGVKRGAPVIATFSEALNPASISDGSLLVICNNTLMAGSVTYSETDAARLTFVPASPLPTYASCTASVPAGGVVDTNGAQNDVASTWHFRTVMLNKNLVVTKSGTGAGRVIGARELPPLSGVYSIDCGDKCSAKVLAGYPYRLHAQPQPGNVFQKWIGCPQPDANHCVIPAVTRDRTVTAKFAVNPNAPRLSISAALPASANKELVEPTVVVTPVNDNLSRVEIDKNGPHPITVNFNPNTNAITSVRMQWVAELKFGICSAAACNTTLNLEGGRVEFANTLLTFPNTDTTATLNGVLTFTPPPVVWKSRTTPYGFMLNGLAYGAEKFVAVGFGNTISTSVDGITWTAVSGHDKANWWSANNVIWDGTQFVMVGDSTNYTNVPPVIATSPDGLTWTRRNWGSVGETQIVDVEAGGGLLTAIGLNGNIRTSNDGGVTWTNEAVVGQYLHAVASNGSTRVIVGRNSDYTGAILVNTGSGWNTVASTGFYGRDVVWTGEQFIAVGSLSASGNSEPVVATSPNGVSWTMRSLPAEEASTGKPLQKIMWHAGQQRAYATGYDAQSSHVIVSSANGSNWTLEYTGSVQGSGMLAGIASSPTRIVTVGGSASVTKP